MKRRHPYLKSKDARKIMYATIYGRIGNRTRWIRNGQCWPAAEAKAFHDYVLEAVRKMALMPPEYFGKILSKRL